MKLNHAFRLLLLLIVASLASCNSKEARKQKELEALKAQQVEDSLSLKVGVLPTLDCLPVLLAKDLGLFDTLQVDVHLHEFFGAIDSDKAFLDNKQDVFFTDLVRFFNLKQKGSDIGVLCSTNLSWQLYSSKGSRITQPKQLKEKIIGLTRFSALSLFTRQMTDSVKMPSDDVFQVQVNNPATRWKMLQNNSIDAAFLPEPFATKARITGHNCLLDTRDKGLQMGVLAYNNGLKNDKRKAEQLKRFLQALDIACQRLNNDGLASYSSIIQEHILKDEKAIKALPKTEFTIHNMPTDKAKAAAEGWLKRQ